ncbi:GntR family transcriptional regulator [Nocardioides bruguierae]|uniref:GntR family transcriptional regulator n=1 Tax=Nocardioides bruguierae TaxID=2945102 RepID=A0A9X2IH37_9ACTN|nr:GntR family transcriptional regulator [Nocardioides bruguierae]MCM0621385.1 GntR family transcriptional regulator [Nocardioides bruguierae]
MPRARPTEPRTETDGPARTVLTGFVPDRLTPVPIHHQLATHLQQAIASGDLAPGTLLPSEPTLVEMLGVSRPTIRRAMQRLVDTALVVRRRGIGTRVLPPRVSRSIELASLHEDLERAGLHPTTQVLDLGLTPATDRVADLLEVRPASPVLRIVRLRLADDVPIALMTNHLPEELAPITSTEIETTSLYRLLRAKAVNPHIANQTVGARRATPEEADTLQEPSSALLTVDQVTYDDRGRAIEVGHHLYAASRYQLHSALLRT